ncbi:MAG: HEPN domain-containing protein [Firmicutes bacterium]|nr:HEPN domain-containing protein [Bacillota bacterium]
MSERDVVQQWLQKSASDLHSAELLLNGGEPANSCYHAQQAGEKALKAYLTQFEPEVPYTHNLELLCKMCLKYDGSFEALFLVASDLTDYATTTRYPGDDSVDAEEAEDCMQKAGHIFMFIQERI